MGWCVMASVSEDLAWSVAQVREGLVGLRAEVDRMIKALDAGRLHRIDGSSLACVLGLVAKIAVLHERERRAPR